MRKKGCPRQEETALSLFHIIYLFPLVGENMFIILLLVQV